MSWATYYYSRQKIPIMKNIFIVFLTVFIVNSAIAQVPSYVDTTGLLAWYEFDSNLNNSYGGPIDNGVNYGSVSYGTDRFGVANACYKGDGSSLMNIPVDDFPLGNATRSACMYFKLDGAFPGGGRAFIAWGANTLGERFGVFTADTMIGLEYVNGYVTINYTPDTLWHDLVVTYPVSGAGSSSVKIYFDGFLRPTAHINLPVPSFNTIPGAWHGVGGSIYFGTAFSDSWVGRLDDGGVWGREISPCEVIYLYYAGNSSLAFASGPTASVTVCEDAVSVSMDSVLAINDLDSGISDTWSIYVPPLHGTLTGGYSTTATGHLMDPTGFYYTPATGFTGLDSFRVRVQDCGGTADTITVYVTVVPSSSSGSITGPPTLCVGALDTLTASLAGGTWGATNTFAAVSGGVVTGLAAGVDTIVYSVRTSCGISTVTMALTINPLPSPPAVASPDVICINGSYTPPSFGDSDVQWYTTPTGGTGSISPPSINTSDTGSYDYWLTLTLYGCHSARTPLVISVVSPFASIAPVDTSVCLGQSYHMRVAGQTGQLYTWSPAAGLNSNTAMAPVVTPSVNMSYLVIVSVPGTATACADTLHASVTVTRLTVNAGTYPMACISSSVQLAASPAGPGYGYLWSGPAGFTSDIQNPRVISIQLSAQGIYTLTVFDDSNGCSGQDTASLFVSDIPPPSVNLGPDTNVCVQYLLSLPVLTNETSYVWSDGSKGQSIKVTETGTYWVAASNMCGIATDTVDVIVGTCEIGLPTAFSPNGDGHNDVLYVRGSGIKTFNLKIYNRYGQMVFETNDQAMGWDGTFNGQPQPVEVYAWVLNARFIDGEPRILKGNVTLLR